MLGVYQNPPWASPRARLQVCAPVFNAIMCAVLRPSVPTEWPNTAGQLSENLVSETHCCSLSDLGVRGEGKSGLSQFLSNFEDNSGAI